MDWKCESLSGLGRIAVGLWTSISVFLGEIVGSRGRDARCTTHANVAHRAATLTTSLPANTESGIAVICQWLLFLEIGQDNREMYE